MNKPIQFTMDTEGMDKALEEIKKDLDRFFKNVQITTEPIVHPSKKEFYSQKMKQKSESYSREWLGTIYYDPRDIQADYLDYPSQPLPSMSGITFVSGILK